MSAELRMYIDNQPATQAQLDLFAEIRVDQAIGMVAEAELTISLRLDDAGNWTDFAEPFAAPFVRIRVEVKPSTGDFAPLIDGPVIGQRFALSASPGASRLTLVVHDDSALLNREESVEVFEEMTDSDIAERLFADAGLDAQVDAIPAAGGRLERAVVQRGTAMQLLRDLARRHGMFVYVKPGPTAGDPSVGVLQRPNLSDSDLPELVLTGEESNLDSLEVEFDGLRPFAAAASQIDAADLSVLRNEAESSSQTALGDEPTHDLAEPARVLLARTRETDNDLSAAADAAADSASWAYSATGELNSDRYPAVLLPHTTIAVVGAGPLSGRYLIARVTHLIDQGSHRQQFALRRNARSRAGGGAGLPGGIF